jgi:hypothetical protein
MGDIAFALHAAGIYSWEEYILRSGYGRPPCL